MEILNKIKIFTKSLWDNKVIHKFIILALFIVGAVFLSNNQNKVGIENDKLLGASYPNAQWFNFTEFTGYQTNVDPEKVEDGANPQGQNTSAFETDRFGVRDYGFEHYPEFEETSTSTGKIASIHNFRKRNGDNILMRSYSDKMEFFDESQDSWVVIKDGLTADKKFGYADYNINTDLTSYVYFGNAYDSFMRWTGSITHLTSDVAIGTTTITFLMLIQILLPSSTLKFICGNDATITGRATTDPAHSKYNDTFLLHYFYL